MKAESLPDKGVSVLSQFSRVKNIMSEKVVKNVNLDPMELSNIVRNPTRPPQIHQEHPLLDRLFGGI